MIEQEFHAHRGAPAQRSTGYCIPDDDTAPHVAQYDDETTWTVDCYHDRHAKLLVKMGCTELPSTHSAGRLFAVRAKELIEFIAATDGLNVEFRKRKKRQLSDEQKAALSERMRTLNAQQRGVLSDG